MKQLHLSNVLLAPHTTEKSALSGSLDNRSYVFKVAQRATKKQIKRAVEVLFQVSVDRVNVCNMKAKPARHGQILGYRRAWKKAYVTLASGQQIDLFSNA